jgi:peptide-methionine (S)-S-oxide reductase
MKVRGVATTALHYEKQRPIARVAELVWPKKHAIECSTCHRKIPARMTSFCRCLSFFVIVAAEHSEPTTRARDRLRRSDPCRDKGGADATRTAILAGGCYWGAQELLRRQPGIISTRVGYSGGDSPHPTEVNLGDHAEAVDIIFDADALSFRDLLEFFFQIHDPMTVNRQGDEVGRSVRSAVFSTSEKQRQSALDTIADVDASGLWPGKVVTEVTEAGPFWEAEENDQDYLQKYPDGATCHFVRSGWKLPRRQPHPA